MEVLVIIAVVFAILWLYDTVIGFKDYQSPKSKYTRTNSSYFPLDSTELDRYELDQFLIMKSRYIRHSKQWEEKRQLVLTRDNHQCQLCSSTFNLNIHHIHYYKLTEEPLSHLVTLCSSCHTNLHEKVGYPQTFKDYMKFDGNIDQLKLT